VLKVTRRLKSCPPAREFLLLHRYQDLTGLVVLTGRPFRMLASLSLFKRLLAQPIVTCPVLGALLVVVLSSSRTCLNGDPSENEGHRS
jgi:hypothetical protein